MRNSIIIMDINAKENVGLVSVFTPATAAIKVNKIEIDQKAPMQANLLHLAAVGLASAAQKKDLVGKRMTIMVPDAISVRAFEALKYKDESAEGIAAHLYKSWMSDGDQADVYAKATSEYASAFKACITAGVVVNIINSRTLYRYELAGDKENLEKLADMTEIELTKSANAELGVAVRQGEFNFANGTYRLIKQTRRGQGGTFNHYYIPRMVQIIDAEGKRQQVPTGMASAMEGVTGATDAYTTLINVLRFRSIAAQSLPKTKVLATADFKVEVA